MTLRCCSLATARTWPACTSVLRSGRGTSAPAHWCTSRSRRRSTAQHIPTLGHQDTRQRTSVLVISTGESSALTFTAENTIPLGALSEEAMSQSMSVSIRAYQREDEEALKELIRRGQWPTLKSAFNEIFHGYPGTVLATASCAVGALASLPFRAASSKLTAAAAGAALVPVGLFAYYNYIYIPDVVPKFLGREFLDLVTSKEPRPAGQEVSACWVATLDDQVVGTISLEQRSESSAELRRMYVHPDCRRQRVGSKLVEVLLAHARKSGINRVTLANGGKDSEAARFYIRHGWVNKESKFPVFGGWAMITLNVMERAV